MPHSSVRCLCITISSLQGVERGEMCAWIEVGTRPCYNACGLCTQKKQRDLFPCDPRLWSCSCWAKGRQSGDRVVQDNSPARPLLSRKEIEDHLHQAGRVLVASSPPARHHGPDPSLQTHSLLGFVKANWFHLRCWVCVHGSTARTAVWGKIVMSGPLHRKSHDWSLMSACGERWFGLNSVLQKDTLKSEHPVPVILFANRFFGDAIS